MHPLAYTAGYGAAMGWTTCVHLYEGTGLGRLMMYMISMTYDTNELDKHDSINTEMLELGGKKNTTHRSK